MVLKFQVQALESLVKSERFSMEHAFDNQKRSQLRTNDRAWQLKLEAVNRWESPCQPEPSTSVENSIKQQKKSGKIVSNEKCYWLIENLVFDLVVKLAACCLLEAQEVSTFC